VNLSSSDVILKSLCARQLKDKYFL